MALTYHISARGTPGTLIYITGSDGVSRGTVIPAMTLDDGTGTGSPLGSAANPLNVTGGSGASSNQVQGTAANGAAKSGNPVRIGYSDGTNAQDLLGDTNGNAYVTLRMGTAALLSGNTTTGALAPSSTGGVPFVTSFNRYFDGTNWQAARGDTNGGWFVQKGGSNIATGQVSVTTSATLVVAARTGRQKVTLTPTTSVVYYVGATGVTTATGVYVPAGASITLDTNAAIYAVGASAVTMSYIEFY